MFFSQLIPVLQWGISHFMAQEQVIFFQIDTREHGTVSQATSSSTLTYVPPKTLPEDLGKLQQIYN